MVNSAATPVADGGEGPGGDPGLAAEGRASIWDALKDIPNEFPDDDTEDSDGSGDGGEAPRTDASKPTADKPGDGSGGDTGATPPANVAPVASPEELNAIVERQIAQREAYRAQQAQAEQYQAWLEQQPADYQLAVMRQQRQEMATFQTARAAAVNQMVQHVTADVANNVPELRNIPQADVGAIHPSNPRFKTPADLLGAWIDYAAEKRAAPVAEKKAKELFEAWKVEESAKMGKAYPRTAVFGEGQNASGGGRTLSVERSSGQSLIRAGLEKALAGKS